MAEIVWIYTLYSHVKNVFVNAIVDLLELVSNIKYTADCRGVSSLWVEPREFQSEDGSAPVLYMV